MEEKSVNSDHPHARDGRSPWLELWLHPRQVTRWFLHSSDPLKNALLLSVIAGVLSAFSSASDDSWGEAHYALPLWVVRVVLTGVIGGLLGYYVGAFFFKWVGSWFGGEGSTDDMRVVIGQISSRGGILLGLLLIPQLLIAGSELFTSATPNLDAGSTRSALLGIVQFIESVLGFWLFIVTLHALGEAHGFSAWKALAVELIFGVAIFIVALAVVLIVFAGSGVPFF